MPAADAVVFHPNGIHIPSVDLWLDPRESVDAAWFSHAHSDHARGYPRIAHATPETLDVYRMRWPDPPHPQQLIPVNFREPRQFRSATLTAFPAAHIAGAALVLIELAGERIVYTGDLKLREPLCGLATQMPECDTLIIESTFGLPIFQFIDREHARARIEDFARECLQRREMPVFLGYPLGRGQEIVHVLSTAGIPVAVHGAIANYIPRYQAAGHAFGEWLPYGAPGEHALVTVPGGVRHLPAKARVAAVSGWAALHNARTRYEASELIPYSDHADFNELLELVRLSRASKVRVVHGYADPLARLLRDRMNIDAQPAGASTAREEAPE